ncbi:MAG: UTP--glucose-1-phosphate uridylyltransferase [Coprobacillus sp.]|nr:UTP--glucose-1-phosphate uridylyltransferase [Coprobacillus sp.]
MSKVNKAVILAAGLGTRFLPFTKAVGKEMLPIIDRPTILYHVEECVKSGIKDIIICVKEDKPEIEKFFTRDEEYEKYLTSTGHPEYADVIKYVSTLANIQFVTIDKPLGIGYSLYQCKDLLGDDPFIVILGDDLIINKDGDPVTKQLIDAYDVCHSPLIGVQTVAPERTKKYGIIKPGKVDGRLIEVKGMIEKPKDNPPSLYACLGRYLLEKDIFTAIEHTAPGAGNEIQLTDALTKLDTLYAYDFIGNRYDIGDKEEFIKATIDIALSREDVGEATKEYIESIK